jgi:hypothetical protein
MHYLFLVVQSSWRVESHLSDNPSPPCTGFLFPTLALMVHSRSSKCWFLTQLCCGSHFLREPWSRVHHEKPLFGHLAKFPDCHGTQRLITVSTRASPYPEPDESSLHPLSLKLIVISSHLHLGLLNSLFPPGFPTNILYMLGSSMCAAYSAHLNRDLVIIILAEFKLRGSAFCNVPQPS